MNGLELQNYMNFWVFCSIYDIKPAEFYFNE